jgi:nucleoid-associated protein YgaU
MVAQQGTKGIYRVTTGSGSNAKALGVGALVVIVIGALVVTFVPMNRQNADQAPAPVEQAAVEPVEVVPEEQVVTEPALVPEETEQENTAQADPVVEETVALEPSIEEAPEVQIVNAPVREDFLMFPDGFATIGGTADPGITIEIQVASEAIERTVADGNGRFAATLIISPSDQPRAMRLIADPDGQAIPSKETYFVQPVIVVAAVEPEPEIVVTPEDVAEPAVEIANFYSEGEPTEEPAVTETVAEIIDETITEQEQTIETETVTLQTDLGTPETEAPQVEPTAPAVLVSDETGVRVLQPAISDQSPEVMATVALDAITYDQEGEVLLAGRALGEGFVQVYLDNKPITTTLVSDEGAWRTDLPDVDTGVYTLRIDEVNESGDVVSRIETPFKREEPETVAEVFAEEVAQDDFEVAMRTVQPGATLWAIARDTFGSGVMYVEVFEANRDRIRDPNLIYPGQVFLIPEISE